MSFWKPKKIEATDRARAALGIAPYAQVEAAGEAAVEQALGVTEAPPPPLTKAKQGVTMDIAVHMEFSRSMVERLNAEEAAIIGDIEAERSAHAINIANLETRLDGARRLRDFHATAASYLAPEEPVAEEVKAAPKPRKARVRGRTAAEAERKPEGQGAANE